MITKWLVKCGLIVTPFLVIPGTDIRDIKLDIAGIVALGIGLSAIYEYGIKPYRNKWLMLFVWVTCSSYFLAPHAPVEMFGIDVTLFWIYKPMYYFLVFGLMLFAISSIKLDEISFSRILHIMTWCGFVTAIYIILQFFKLDQVFTTCTDGTYGHMAGFVGNPTHVSPFIAMIIPICLYLRRRTMAITGIVAVLMTRSEVALVAMIISLMFYVAMKSKRAFFTTCATVALICIIVAGMASFGVLRRDMVTDHERFEMWGKILTDTKTPQKTGSNQIYPLTGLGMGTFKYVFPFQHKNGFQQAHNDYLELLYNAGIIGLGLFLAGIALFFKKNFNIKGIFNKEERSRFYSLKVALFASLVCVCVSAGGTFIWQIGTTIYYSILIMGLISNNYLGGKDEEKNKCTHSDRVCFGVGNQCLCKPGSRTKRI